MPERIQRCRTKGWRLPEGAVYVGRPGKWGNPYVAAWNKAVDQFEVRHNGELVEAHRYRNDAAAAAVRHFRADVEADVLLAAAIAAELRGKDLACWCWPDDPCHADVLLAVANELASQIGD